MNRPASRNVNRPTSQNVNRPTDQNVNRSTRRNVNRPTSQHVTRPTSQNMNRRLNQPTNRPTRRNVNQITNRPPRANRTLNPFVCRSCNIAQLFDWELCVGKWLITVDRFLLCIPLKPGSYITATISLVNSLVSLGLIVHVVYYNSDYLKVYERKMDVLICSFIYFSSTVYFIVTSIFLIAGTYFKKPILIKIYLWGVVIHVFVSILNSLVFSIYCTVNYDCFQGTGLLQPVISFVYVTFYTLIWFYLASVINSMLKSQQVARPFNKSTQSQNQHQTTNRQSVRQTSNRSENRATSTKFNRTLNQPTNLFTRQKVNQTSNQPVYRSPKRTLK